MKYPKSFSGLLRDSYCRLHFTVLKAFSSSYSHRSKTIEVRQLALRDLDGIISLLKDRLPGDERLLPMATWAKEQIKSSFKLSFYIGMLFEGELIGLSRLFMYHWNTVETMLFIRPGFRKKGFGKLLLIHNARALKKLRIKWVFVTILKDNVASMNLHANLGFKKISSDKNKIYMRVNVRDQLQLIDGFISGDNDPAPNGDT